MFIQFNFKNESFFDHTKDLPLFKKNRKPSIAHQIYIFIPKAIWFIYDANILQRDDWSKESWNNSVIEINYDTTDDEYWGRIEFSITDREVLRKISPEHKLIFILSDGMFTHTENMYWLETLPFGIHVTGGGKYPMSVVCKLRTEVIKRLYVLKVDVFVNDSLKVTYDGFPIFMYAINTIVTADIKYDWDDMELGMQDILKLLNTQYSEIESADLPNALSRIDVLAETLKTQVDTVHQLQVKVDIPTIQMDLKSEVKQELMLNISSQGSGFWGSLFGGLGVRH